MRFDDVPVFSNTNIIYFKSDEHQWPVLKRQRNPSVNFYKDFERNSVYSVYIWPCSCSTVVLAKDVEKNDPNPDFVGRNGLFGQSEMEIFKTFTVDRS